MMICMKLATAQKYFVSVDVPSTLKTSYQCFQTAVQVRVARIDESVLLECLRLLEDCDPTGERPDPPELAEAEVNSYAQVGSLVGSLCVFFPRGLILSVGLLIAFENVSLESFSQLKREGKYI